jgi:hypothetical protein
MQPHVNTELCKPVGQMLKEKYEANGQPYLQSTKPYHSVQAIRWDIVQADTVNGVAMAVAAADQVLRFFAYGIGSNIRLSGSTSFVATEAETNIAVALKTNNDDFAIMWVGSHARGNKILYGAAQQAAFGDTNATVANAVSGIVPLVDPFSQRINPEFGSPATLEMVAFHALAPYLALQFAWDNGDRTEKVGVLSQYTQGGGASYLHANGEPSTEARSMIPEGYLWAREGQPASQLQAVATLTQPVVMPISLAALPGAGTFEAPTALWTEIVLELGGIHFRVPGSN